MAQGWLFPEKGVELVFQLILQRTHSFVLTTPLHLEMKKPAGL
jgi:hypothetical protein